MKKILLSKLRALGDTVLLSATLGETRRLFPGDEIHLLIPEVWRDLYRHDPRVKQVWTFDTRLRGWSRTLAFFRLARELRHLDVDISLACHASPTSSWLGFLSGAQERAHHNHNFLEANRLGNLEIPEKKILKPFIHRDLAVLQALEKKVDLTAESRLFVGPGEREWARREVSARALRGPLLGLGLGASRPTKIWPLRYFAELAREWQRIRGGSVLAFVSPSEVALGEEWKRSLPESSFQVASHYSVAEMMALMTELRLFLGNDSGPRHLAAALGVPTVTLYGPQDPFECHPYSLRRHPYFFIENLACRTHTDLSGQHPWCGLQRCEVEAHRCLVELRVAPVLQKCLEVTEA